MVEVIFILSSDKSETPLNSALAAILLISAFNCSNSSSNIFLDDFEREPKSLSWLKRLIRVKTLDKVSILSNFKISFKHSFSKNTNYNFIIYKNLQKLKGAKPLFYILLIK